MKKQSKIIIMLTAVFMMVSLFSSFVLAETKELDFIWFTDGFEDEVMEEIISDFQEENPDIEINLIETPAREVRQRVMTRVAGGNPPDLARLTLPGALKEALLDLTPYLGENYKENYMESTHPYIHVNDNLIALPMDVTANGILYNKEYFSEAGVDVPTEQEDIWTWDEWIDALETVVDNTNARFGAGMDYTPHRWSTLLYQAGGSFFNEAGDEMEINSPEGERAIEYFVELHDKGLMPTSVWLGGEDPQTLFRAGQTAVHFAGNWMLTAYKDDLNFDWGVAYMPYEERRSSVPGGKYIAAFEDSDYSDEAAQFIEYFSSQEVDAKFNRESLFMSARVDNAQLDYEFGSEMFEIFSNELEATPAVAGSDWANSDVMNQLEDDILQTVVQAIQHRITPEEAVQLIEEHGNEVLDD